MKRHEITVDSLLADLETDRALAHSQGQGSAAVQATMAKARLLGLIVDRKESGAPGDFATLQTSAEVIEAVRREHGDAAADALARLIDSATPTTPAPSIAGATTQEHGTADDTANTPRTTPKPTTPTNSGSGTLN